MQYISNIKKVRSWGMRFCTFFLRMGPNWKNKLFKITPTFIDDSTSVLIERDAILKNVMKIGVCEQNIYAEEVGSLYEFDLNTGIRNLKDYQYYDLCNGTETVEGDKVSEVGLF